MSLAVSVVIPAHNPDHARLRRALTGLRRQTLPSPEWETVIVDNASQPPLVPSDWADIAPANMRHVWEPTMGLTFARRRGLLESRGAQCIFVDDDNVLAPDYLALVVRLFAAHPRVGALGGKSVPEFEIEPPVWAREFFPLLALRDLGAVARLEGGATAYPSAAPIGAGMALRRNATQAWLAASGSASIPDRSGDQLSSGGDNDIVFTLLGDGWHVGYFPELSLTHLIPASRLTPDYFARLNRGIQCSWMRVLTKHHANPWPPVARWTVPLRQLKAWFTHRAWAGSAERIRWQGARGHFEGRVIEHVP